MSADLTLTSPWLHVRPHHGEGVGWDHRSGVLAFVDVTHGRIWQTEPATGRLWSFEVPSTVGAVHPTEDGESLIIADSDGIALCRGGTVVSRLAAPLAGRDDLRMNDANVDPAGRYFAGSMAFDARPAAGDLYRLDPDGTLTTAVAGTTISNGIDWSPDARLCYYVDSTLRRIDVFDYDVATGALAGRRPFADVSDLPGVPDGLTVDASGGVWVAFFGGARVCRFDPTGARTTTVHLPAGLVTSCCFGGPDLDELYISTSTEGMSAAEVAREPAAGGVFLARPGWRGRPATPFRLPAERPGSG
ncbi:SMP-30/gluconolactonase/LRE family protein [Dactylosporangium sp. CA-092794]|uniref:SMP-30/gluconolactonase/LRE family protein n=1 Tax=Dactylosporangium sp. CA-092794 TaxID=3239929 RepID=UPI003D8AF713